MSDENEPTIKDKIDAQRDLRIRRKTPCFAADNGVCYGCGKNAFSKMSLENAGKYLITGCPHCNRSYIS